jgi:hypothetical protein
MRTATYIIVCGALVLSACSDAPDLTGTYHEQTSISAGFPQDQWFAVGVDMFQYEEEVGGIVRYYSLKDARPNSSTFDPENERFCFWLPPTRVTSDEREFQLEYEDIHWPERADATLALRTDANGDTLTGFKSTNCNHPLCQGRTPDIRCDGGCLSSDTLPERDEEDLLPGIRGPVPAAEVDRAMRLSRVSTDPDNTCTNRARHIVLEPKDLDAETEAERVLQVRNTSGPLWSDRSARRFTYTVAWAGDDVATYTTGDPENGDSVVREGEGDDDEIPFVFDWYRRATDTPALQRVAFDRWLPPGFWKLAPTDFGVRGSQARMVIGTYFLYYEDASNFSEPPYDASSARWNPRTEPIVAAPFAESEEPGALEGTVVVWIEGRPSALPDGIQALFPADATVPEGYSLWDAVIDARDSPGEVIRFKSPRNGRSLVRLHVRRTFDQYEHPKHTELSIARLPVR